MAAPSSTSDASETFLNDAAGWREEAEGVIKDVRDCVKDFHIAKNLESSSSSIFLNLTTFEGCRYTVELTAQGFRVAGRDHERADIRAPDDEDDDAAAARAYFETPYALLDGLSPGFRVAFGNSLTGKLEQLAERRKREEEEEESRME